MKKNRNSVSSINPVINLNKSEKKNNKKLSMTPEKNKKKKEEEVKKKTNLSKSPRKKHSSRIQISKSIFVQYKEGLIEKDYEILDTVGSGAFATVKKVIHKLRGQIRALKITSKKTTTSKISHTIDKNRLI